jgi:muramoyltetrapeptide carboxypeptidase
MKTLKAPRLRRGDCVGLVSPASAPSAQEKIDKGVRYLEGLGYRVRVGQHVMDQHGYLAGSDEHRAEDLNAMLRDPLVKAIVAVRGGYGTPRLLHLVDYNAVRRAPKIIVGYSDITALQLALYRKTGLVTFSGPMLGVEMWDNIDPYTEEHFWRLLTSPSKVGNLKNPQGERIVGHNPGKARGILLGGNLSLLMSLFGTPYAPNLRSAILAAEDVDEAPHRIDRMFAQLFLSGVFRRIAGLLLGKFTDCMPSDPTKPYLTVEQVVEEMLRNVRCPVLTNVQFGHIPKKLTLPLGIAAAIDSRAGHLNILEGAVR